MKIKRILCLFCSVILAMSLFTGCKSQTEEDQNQDAGVVRSLEDLYGRNIGVLTGSIWDGVAKEDFPDSERKYFTTVTDMIIALEQRKISTFFIDRTVYTNMRWENAPVTVLDETVGEVSNAVIMAKDNYDRELLEQINAFIARSRENGVMDELAEKWFSDTEPEEHPDYSVLTGENGTLKIAVENAQKPMAYRKNNVFTGYEVEFLTRFAQEQGYRLVFEGMAFDALIPSVASGKCDIGACGISITPERAESVTFAEPHFETEGVVVVNQTAEQADQAGFLDSVSESFDKTFIREDRWKLIVEGVGVTLLISLCAGVAGTLLGFALYMLSDCEIKPLRQTVATIAKVHSRIVAGTPVVVILMILFYVVFGNLRDISGILVAIIGFTVTFSAFVNNHMAVAVNSVDLGQLEAAYALGYTKYKAFFQIIFPQAMTIFLPTYCGQAVELVKATAIVGYIAVNDLTKMGDIIRSNTYEAFFPLFTTALIYFILTWILAFLLGYIKLYFEPKRRSDSKILKGVKTE